ncbi:MAG: hypothetical protein DI568_06535 [Sphingomonas sp.]|nr:MAG: hypothetical protein DI568_06535 [Sphingomonas sp.]
MRARAANVKGAGMEGLGIEELKQGWWRRPLKWLAIAGGVALFASGVAFATLWSVSEERLSRQFPADAPALRVSGAANVAEGGRLVQVYGCTACHGKELAGTDFYGIQTPSIRRLAKLYGADGFAFAVRHGVRPDGTALTWNMPSDFLSVMADDQIRDIQAYLASLPEVPDDVSATRMPMKRLGVAVGELLLIPDVWRPEPVPAKAPKPGDPAFGPYFARVACAECHGFDLNGFPDGSSPPLSVVARAYDLTAFKAFLKTGKNLGGQELPMMSGVARWRLSHMTEAEVEALHAHLTSLPLPGE